MNVLTLPAPHPGAVHVWRIGLDMGPARHAALAAYLSDEEHLRASRFHFTQDRERWSTARGARRQVLGQYLGMMPEDVRVETGPYGKPHLCHASLRFNVSHSHGMALIAVAWGREIGVDIECLRADFVPEELAEGALSLEEQAWLCAVPTAAQHEAFLTLWTGKEAYVKARGEGLSFPLTQLTLRPDRNTPEIQVCDLSDDGTHPHLSVCRLTVGAGFLGALAFEGAIPEISYFDYDS